MFLSYGKKSIQWLIDSVRKSVYFFEPPEHDYWLTRFLFLRCFGIIYVIAFLCLYQQLLPLIGENGIVPAGNYLNLIERVAQQKEIPRSAVIPTMFPTLFWHNVSDEFMLRMAQAGLIVSGLVAMGFTNAFMMAFLWYVYASFVAIGQIFYGFGWEIMMMETGFLAIFLCPLFSIHPFPEKSPPPKILMWLLRWLAFRLMFGAGLIKIRGDSCWWPDLTCLVYHYETQPIPNPISWYLHQAPLWFHKLGVLWNHVVELIVPWLIFGPRAARVYCGILFVSFQFILIISGNLSFLNWLSVVIFIACFDDRALALLFPENLINRLRVRPAHWVRRWGRGLILLALTFLVIYMSKNPVLNMISKEQVMNTSFDRYHIVNTYGAFGHVGKERYEVIISGTTDRVVTSKTQWREYEFKCKPGKVDRRPGLIAPFQYRLDWEIWFAAMSNYQQHSWLMHMIEKLFHNDPGVLSLIDVNPFPDQPPTFIKADLYLYEFTSFADAPELWWKRTFVRSYFPAIAADNPSFRKFLAAHGWGKK